jgi:ferritin-like metal-binding protein YciE
VKNWVQAFAFEKMQLVPLRSGVRNLNVAFATFLRVRAPENHSKEPQSQSQNLKSTTNNDNKKSPNNKNKKTAAAAAAAAAAEEVNPGAAVADAALASARMVRLAHVESR